MEVTTEMPWLWLSNEENTFANLILDTQNWKRVSSRCEEERFSFLCMQTYPREGFGVWKRVLCKHKISQVSLRSHTHSWRACLMMSDCLWDNRGVWFAWAVYVGCVTHMKLTQPVPGGGAIQMKLRLVEGRWLTWDATTLHTNWVPNCLSDITPDKHTHEESLTCEIKPHNCLWKSTQYSVYLQHGNEDVFACQKELHLLHVEARGHVSISWEMLCKFHPAELFHSYVWLWNKCISPAIF